MQLSIQEQDWASVVARVESAIDLEASVRASGALSRKRQIQSGSDLLRLALAYGPGGQSLRETAAWAEYQEIASLSDVALLYRFQGAADWLGEIAGALLAQRSSAAAMERLGLRLRIIDGSQISPPGKKERLRLHAVYDVAEERFSQLQLTSRREAEALERMEMGPGELVMGDRVYARPGGLHHVAAAGADFLVRLGQRSLSLTFVDGSAFDLAAVLDESDRTGSHDITVRVLDGSDLKREPLVARVVVLKKPPEAAATARKQAQRESQRGGHVSNPMSLRAAEHLMLITSLAPDQATCDQLAALYRLRWRIELAFKRLKSLLHLDRLPAKDQKLTKAWIFAHLIAALLIEDLSPVLRDSPP